MSGVFTDPVERLRHALFPVNPDQFHWRIASVIVSVLSIVLIILTISYKLRGSEPPSALMLVQLLAFATVLVLLSRFLGVARQEEGQTRVAYKISEREFQSVFENALDAILILDDQAICREANPAAEQLFGLKRLDLVGRPMSTTCKRERAFETVWQQLRMKKLHKGEVELVGRADSSVFVEFSAKADYLPSRHVMILRDITARRLAQEEAEALRKATLALTQDLRMDYVMDTLLKTLMELVPYTCARVLVPEGGDWWQALGERMCGQTSRKGPAPPLHLCANESIFLKKLIAEHKSVLIRDTIVESEWPSFGGHQNLRSWLSVPLIASDQYLGFLSIGHTGPNRFSCDHLRRAELLSVPAAAAIQNARLYEMAQIYGSELQKQAAGKQPH